MKLTTYIQYTEAIKYMEAVERAPYTLNTLVTINIEMLGVPAKNCSAYLRESLQRLKKLLARRECPWSAVWVLENSLKSKVHAHVIIHRNEFFLRDHCYFRRLLKQALGFVRYPAKMLQFTAFRKYLPYALNLERVMNYSLKGIRPEVAKSLCLYWKPQGKIYGKRIGWYRYDKEERISHAC
ncbi:MAG: hypothetical protein HWE30_13780 [Methylocystaceae bacterium]|nr:hypothetical protein [Methylocystaceae bacterium]